MSDVADGVSLGYPTKENKERKRSSPRFQHIRRPPHGCVDPALRALWPALATACVPEELFARRAGKEGRR